MSDLQAPTDAIAAKGNGIGIADLVTVAGYGLGVWWASGGPGWAALASMACDELDGPIAQLLGTETRKDDSLHWGADVALTPLALFRLSKDLDKPAVAAVGAPLTLAAQAKLRAQGFMPPVGSARAVVMGIALFIEYSRRRQGLPPRANGRRQRREER